MVCPRCYGRGHYTAILGRPATRHGNKEERMCSCEAGLAMRWPLLSREEIRSRGLDVDLWRHTPDPTKKLNT